MPQKPSKLLLSLALYILAGLAWVGVYVYVFVWLIACALIFQWGAIQQSVALTLTASTLMAVWFLTKKIHNILVELAKSRIGCYTVYMIDAHNDDSNKETTGGELFIQAVGWTVLIIMGFWGAVHVLLSLMEVL